MSTTPAIIIGLQDALRLSQHVASPEGGKLPVWSLKEAAARLSEMDAENKRLREALGMFLPEADDGLVSFSEAIANARAALEHDKGEPKP